MLRSELQELLVPTAPVRSRTVAVRMTDRGRQLLEAVAAARGLTLSQLLTDFILDGLAQASESELGARPE